MERLFIQLGKNSLDIERTEVLQIAVTNYLPYIPFIYFKTLLIFFIVIINNDINKVEVGRKVLPSESHRIVLTSQLAIK